jgi:hypothetical protein
MNIWQLFLLLVFLALVITQGHTACHCYLC